MINKKGFTLIELLIYFFLVVSIVSGVFYFVASIQIKLIDFGNKSGNFFQLCTALDAISRDLYAAPADTLQWEQVGPKSISWKQKNKKNCWKMEDSCLVRISSTFDEARKIWNKNKKSLVAKNISKLEFAPHYFVLKKEKKENFLSSITCTIKSAVDKACFIKKTFALRNRVLL